MKKLFLILMVLIILTPVFASYKVFMNDIGIRFGHGAFLDKDFGGLHAMAGLTIGLTERLEFNPMVIFPVVPKPLNTCNAGFELGYSLFGNRVNSNGVAGSNFNSIICLGVFTEGIKPTFLTLRVVPLSLGMPSSGRRENMLPIGIAWDFVNNKFSCFMSIAMYDHYVKGTWAQLRKESVK